ncbi:Endonuclease [Aphelenchoides besseyi]|nr:Endonuclease [Aphelenchoides besseyi]KAI6223500.1 Endonuclease [Aphelenchoides besseyi]
MSRYLFVAAASSASFLLGWQWSERRHEWSYGLVREGCAATALVAQPPNPSDLFHDVRSAATFVEKPSRASEIMKFGYPGFDNLRTFTDFVVSYDRRTRTAHWVLEHLTPECLVYDANIERSKSVFKPDESIHPFFRSLNEDYRGSGFDRGHLAAAGNHRRSQLAMDQTFYLTNMSPQVGKGFNRDKWNDLERYVRKMAKTSKNVYIVTGPLYLPRVEADGKSYVKYQVIGKNNVAVPTHFFKAALVESAGGFELFSWILPNAMIPDEKPLDDFLVPLDAIERAAGLLIFEKFPRQSLIKINGKKLGGFFS